MGSIKLWTTVRAFQGLSVLICLNYLTTLGLTERGDDSLRLSQVS